MIDHDKKLESSDDDYESVRQDKDESPYDYETDGRPDTPYGYY